LSIEDVLEQTLKANENALWLQAWRSALWKCVATGVLSKINLEDGSIAAGWSGFDAPARRAQLVNADSSLQQSCLAELLTLEEPLNAALARSGFKKRTRPGMERHLKLILPKLIQQSTSKTEIAVSPFPGAWRAVADLLAQQAYRQSAKGSNDYSEVRVHNTLLLSGFFLACQQPTAADVEITLRKLGRSMLSIRGSIVRIAENISASGVVDQIPRSSSRSGGIRLQLAGLSDLLQATVDESQQIAAGNGVLHRVTEGSSPAPQWLRGARDIAYRQYEYTLLTYMTLASIEQLIRVWASAKGENICRGGRPRDLASLIARLGGSPSLRKLLAEVCDIGSANIRGRVMHGGLLEVESKRSEALLNLIKPATPSYQDPFAPQNICQLCLECLELLDKEASVLAISQKDLQWTNSFWLTPAELDTGRYLHCEFLDPVAQGDWWKYIATYLNAVVPHVKQFFTVGFMGWMGSGKDRLVRFMAAVLIFESLYRATVQLHGIRVLQVSGDRHIQYRMLDERQLCAPDVMDVLTRSIPNGERPVAWKVYNLSVKARNAFAHGAVTRPTTEDLDCLGHLVVKSVQGLVGAGMHEMTKVAAYYRWQKTGRRIHGRDLENWLAGEDEVYSLLEQFGQLPKREQLT
jgi:hypothetical protein